MKVDKMQNNTLVKAIIYFNCIIANTIIAMIYYNYQILHPHTYRVCSSTTDYYTTTTTTTITLITTTILSFSYTCDLHFTFPAAYKYKEISIQYHRIKCKCRLKLLQPPPNTFLILLIIILPSLALNSTHVLLLLHCS
jgi:hypothetical protein